MKGCILPFPKNVNLGLAKNYRGITITSIAVKIYNALLRNHIEPKIYNILRKNENGFRRNKSTTSKILSIRRIFEGVRAKNLQAKILFVDFTKAFDSILRGKMEKNSSSIRHTKRDGRSYDCLRKHQSESAFSGWRHRLHRHHTWSTARRHS